MFFSKTFLPRLGNILVKKQDCDFFLIVSFWQSSQIYGINEKKNLNMNLKTQMLDCSHHVLLCVATVSGVTEKYARVGKYCRARDAAGSGATPRMPGYPAQKYLGQCHQP
jgi:hypothetical protein